MEKAYKSCLMGHAMKESFSKGNSQGSVNFPKVTVSHIPEVFQKVKLLDRESSSSVMFLNILGVSDEFFLQMEGEAIVEEIQEVVNSTEMDTAISQEPQECYPPGIHFSSLECNDELTSWGANWFGMPYQVATMERTFDDKSVKQDGKSPARFRLTSRRYASPKPSIFRMFGSAIASVFQKSTNVNVASPETAFAVDCSWSLCNQDDNTPPNSTEKRFANAKGV